MINPNMRQRIGIELMVLPIVAAMIVPRLSTAAASPEAVNLRRTVVVDVAERTKDAVVYISTRKLVQQRFSPLGDPALGAFDLGKVEAGSLGSGFIVHKDGYIVTNNHVIDRARQIEVELLDGQKLPAELVSADPDADVAILRVHSEKQLHALELGDSSHLLIGEPVIAVGNPLGFSHSVSTGIISAEHRDLDRGNGQKLADLIQTDAAINPGNSGGPLLNAYGQVVGINTAIRGDAQNIGFAIGINRLRNLIPDLMNPAEAIKVDVPVKLSEKVTFTEPSTLTTQIIMDGNSAPIASINGEKPANIIDAYAILLQAKDGQPVQIKLTDGAEQNFAAKATPTPDAIVQAKDKLGIIVEPLTPITAQRYGLSDEDGMLITEVLHDSVAAKTGLQPGDVIIALGRHPVNSLKDFSALMHFLPEHGRVWVGIARAGQRGRGALEL